MGESRFSAHRRDLGMSFALSCTSLLTVKCVSLSADRHAVFPSGIYIIFYYILYIYIILIMFH